MPKYQYTVINEDNNQLQGTIGAPDEKSARKELNDLGFSILSIQEIAENIEQETTSQSPVFEFSAIDKNQKKIVGTIQSEDAYSAFKRLITEYEFEIEYIIDNALPEKDKEKERKKGAYGLYEKYEEEKLATQKKESSDEKDLKEFEKQQEVLKRQIDFVLNKVKEMLDAYETLMKQEEKEKIRNYVEKLLRIRTSTNLDYIRKTAEELLFYLQKEELFLHEEARAKERTKMLVEAKSMMMQLRKGKSKTSMNLTEALRAWRKDHILEKKNPTSMEKFLDIFVQMLIGAKKENEEIIELKRQLSTINNQIWQFFLLFFQATSRDFKNETTEGIKRLLQERKKIKKQIKDLQKTIIIEKVEEGETSIINTFLHESLSFTGWLLACYLVYYFVSLYLLSKNLGNFEVPYIFYIYKSAFLKYFLATLFLFHSAVSLKVHIFKNSSVATLIILPVFLLSTLIVYLNF